MFERHLLVCQHTEITISQGCCIDLEQCNYSIKLPKGTTLSLVGAEVTAPKTHTSNNINVKLLATLLEILSREARSFVGRDEMSQETPFGGILKCLHSTQKRVCVLSFAIGSVNLSGGLNALVYSYIFIGIATIPTQTHWKDKGRLLGGMRLYNLVCRRRGNLRRTRFSVLFTSNWRRVRRDDA